MQWHNLWLFLLHIASEILHLPHQVKGKGESHDWAGFCEVCFVLPRSSFSWRQNSALDCCFVWIGNPEVTKRHWTLLVQGREEHKYTLQNTVCQLSLGCRVAFQLFWLAATDGPYRRDMVQPPSKLFVPMTITTFCGSEFHKWIME